MNFFIFVIIFVLTFDLKTKRWRRNKNKKIWLVCEFLFHFLITFLFAFFLRLQSHKSPKASMKVVSANVTFCTNKINNPNALQISWTKDGFTRSIFVYSESGKEIIDWYCAIRATKLRHLQIAFPEVPVNELVMCLSRDFINEGYLWKTGPRTSDAYKKRWFILDESRKLMYLEHPLVSLLWLHNLWFLAFFVFQDPYPKGEIFIGDTSEGYSVAIGIPHGWKDFEQGHAFTLSTPGESCSVTLILADRRRHLHKYLFLKILQKKERNSWIKFEFCLMIISLKHRQKMVFGRWNEWRKIGVDAGTGASDQQALICSERRHQRIDEKWFARFIHQTK